VLLIAFLSRPLEVTGQQITPQYDQGNREEACEGNERKGPKDLNDEK
jgi:hypothetical protein